MGFLAGGILFQIGSYTFYRHEKDNPSRRSYLLNSMLFVSILLWVFVGFSLVLCTAFLADYERSPHQIGRLVLGSSILGSIVVSSGMTVAARRFGVPRILEKMTGESYSGSRLAEIFASLCRRMGITGAELRKTMAGSAFSIDSKGKRVVAVSPELVASLSADESEAVLAHELSHLKNHDSRSKGLARLARFGFPFDPSIRLIEAAIHRERELLADRESVRYTEKPLALASALIRVHSAPLAIVQSLGAGLFVGGSSRGLFSLYPDLERRIELLLQLANRLKTFRELQAPAQ